MLFQTSNLISEKKQSAELAERSLMAYRTINAQEVQRADKLIGSISPGEGLHLISHGKVNSYDLLFAMIDRTPQCAVIITTWGLGEYPLRQLAARTKNMSGLYFIFSDKLKTMKPNEFQLATAMATGYRTYPCHAKLMVVMNSVEGWVMNSSMNFNRNNKLEAGVVVHDLQTARSYAQALMPIIDDNKGRTTK